MPAVGSLKVFAIAGRTDSAGAAQNDLDQEEARLLLAALLRPGFTQSLLDATTANPNAFRVRQNTGTDMNVKVGSTTSKVDGYVLRGTVAGQGSYLVRLDSTGLVVSVPATDPTNPARYGCYLFVDDAAYSGDASRAYAGITVLRGTPAGSPTTPGPLAVWSASQLLWEWQLPANATAVTNAILDGGQAIDQRTPSEVGLGVSRAYTPVITWGGGGVTSGPSARYQKIGNILHVWGSFTIGTISSGAALQISLPAGTTILANLGAGSMGQQSTNTGAAFILVATSGPVLVTGTTFVGTAGGWWFHATIPQL